MNAISRLKVKTVFVAIALLLVSLPSFAFINSSQNGPIKDIDVEAVAAFSKQVEHTLAKEKARVAIVARTGRAQSELPDGVTFTHIGFAVYSDIIKEDGEKQRGYAMYNLYQTTERLDRSELVQDYPFKFFSQAHSMKAGIIIPEEALQRRILEVIHSPLYKKLHNPVYSAMASPFNNNKQNCTEFALNVIQAALYDTEDMGDIKNSINAHFEPYKIAVNPFKVMLGAMLSSELAVTDHQGDFRTTTFSTIKQYMEENGLAKKTLLIVK